MATGWRDDPLTRKILKRTDITAAEKARALGISVFTVHRRRSTLIKAGEVESLDGKDKYKDFPFTRQWDSERHKLPMRVWRHLGLKPGDQIRLRTRAKAS